MKMKLKTVVEEERDYDTRAATNLVEKALKLQKEKEGENLKLEKQSADRKAELMKQELSLQVKIITEQELVEKMTLECEAILQEKEQAHLIELSRSEVSKESVKSGEITMSEFISRGKEDHQIADMARSKALEELKQGRITILEKNLEILKIKMNLYQVQCQIHALIISPARSLGGWYAQLKILMDENLSPFESNMHTAKSNLKATESEILQIEHGVGMGKIWRGLTIKQAYRLIFNPIIQEEFVEDLLDQLIQIEAEVGGSEVALSVTYHPEQNWPGDPITVRIE